MRWWRGMGWGGGGLTTVTNTYMHEYVCAELVNYKLNCKFYHSFWHTPTLFLRPTNQEQENFISQTGARAKKIITLQYGKV